MVDKSAAKDRLRIRELSKYYCASSPLQLGGSRSRAEDRKDASGNFTAAKPQLAPDATLTGLAQLAALKLRAQRSIISFIDDHAQHVLAEATQSLSPFDLDDHEPDDELILGVQSLPIESCICSIALDAFVGDNTLKLTSPGSFADHDSIVIPDLTKEPCTMDTDIIKVLPPILRYYVEVPLRNDAGYVLGSICVIDREVRSPGPRDIQGLQQVSKLVVEHLEWSRMKQDHHRAERSLEGLSHFIQGKGSLSEWSKLTFAQTDIPSAFAEPAPLSSSYLQHARSNDSAPDPASPPSAFPDSAPTSPTATIQSSFNLLRLPDDGAGWATNPTSGGTQPPTPAINRSDTDVQIGSDPPVRQMSTDDVQASSLASLSIRQAFSRAANLIRESMDLDATCFLEVPQNERYKNPKKKDNARRPPKVVETASQNASETESMTDGSSEFTLKDTAKEQNDPQDDGTSRTNEVLCHRLGFSTRTKSSLAGSETLQPYLTIPTSLLSQLTNIYGEGHIFHFDNSGVVSSGEETDAGQQPRRKSARKRLSDRLFHLFPTARSLIFLPLFDNDKQHIYAGFLGWTTDPTRALQKNETIYVSGFANSIMCEVMRLQAMATDKAKSDFISSISHELRSPLHGILAAAQLLLESKSADTQEEYVEMIDTCARTLLDIMNHLLDYAKINHFTGSSSRKKSSMKGKQQKDSTSYSLVTKMNLLSVVEETSVSMVASSYRIRQRDGPQTTKPSNMSDTSLEQDVSEALSVPIILNIAPNTIWTFSSEPGSWRRIVMNLIGNSLKYTQQGHISVSLSLRNHAKSNKKCIAELKVTDTGQGISEDYLKHRLYTPFAQENNLSVGAGLGLSLVHQIVSALKGSIQVHSEVGTGTEILVQVPLEIPERSVANDGIPAGIQNDELSKLTKGRTFEFRGFANAPLIDEQPTGILSPRTKALLTMSNSLSQLLQEWYELKAVSTGADIIVIEETFLRDNLDQYDTNTHKLLVISLDGLSNTTDKIKHANYQYIFPPVGPKRMAHALKKLLQVQDQKSKQSETQSSVPLSPPKSADTIRDSNNDHRPTISPLDQHSSKRSLSSAEKDSRPPRRPKMPPSSHSSTRIVPLRTKPSTTPCSSLNENIPASPPGPALRDAILLVDDNDINLRILVACITKLKNSDTDYITASDGQQALDRYTDAINIGMRIPIIFMDISMPVMDGFTSTRKIRAFEKERGLRSRDRSMIIALTGLASAEAQHEIENSGFDLYLRKPVSLKTVREIMGSRKEEVKSPTE